MKTQQAHSLGGTRFGASEASPRRVSPVLWLNLVCLDAPLVAIMWLWMFARNFGVRLQPGNCIALFLTAWLIYLGDRLADCSSLPVNGPRSLRQEFCRRHREIWIVLIALVAGFDAYVISRAVSFQTLLVVGAVGAMAIVYLVVNHPLGLIWRSLPAKEFAIGILFAAGTMVALMPQVPANPAFVLAACSFAALCSLNCVSIARWERELDRSQGKVSIATRHPGIVRYAGPVGVLLALAAFVLAIVFQTAGWILVCLGTSALLLAWLNTTRPIDRDQRTALADLVLLTPLVLCLATVL